MKWQLTVTLGILISLLSGCAVPKGTVIVFGKDVPARGILPIPAEWDGRFLAVGGIRPALAGDAMHFHSTPHSHTNLSIATLASSTFQPLGVDQVVAGALHTHALVSGVTERDENTAGANLPRSREFTAGVAKHSSWHAPEGMIICYLGTNSPAGWIECNGQNGTPDLVGLYVRLRSKMPIQGVVGVDEHLHTNEHRHSWRAAPPQYESDRALAIDNVSSNLQNTGTAATLEHVHVVDDPGVGLVTSVATNLPPSLSVRFLIASKPKLQTPAGALMGYQREVVPLGWSRFKWDEWVMSPRLLRGADQNFSAGLTFGGESHHHILNHTHRLSLDQTAAKPLGIRTADGSPVASGSHTHTIDVSNTVVTSESSHLPPIVAVPFIIKN